MMWIKRKLEALLQERIEERPVIVVTGCRQVGKTSLLEHILPDTAFVSLDNYALAEEAEEDGRSFLNRYGQPLIIDEIQYAPKLLRAIKQRVDERRQLDGQYFLTGSQHFEMMANVTESLAGRVGIVTCHSLSAEEIESFHGQAMEGEALLNYIFQGGYPEIYARERKVDRFYSDYVAAYITRDVRQLIQVRNLRDFDRFLRMLALRTGQMLSAHALAADLQLSPHTVRSWLSVLESSNIIVMIAPYFQNLGKRLVKTPKMYFSDTGLACYLAGIQSPAELQRSPLLGPLFETHVAGQLLRFFHNRGRRPMLYFYRDHQGHEIDFVLALGDKVHLLECKWGEHPSLRSAGFTEFGKLLNPQAILSKTIITSRRGYYQTGKQIQRGDSVDFNYLL